MSAAKASMKLDADTVGGCAVCLMLVAFCLPAMWHIYDADNGYGHGGLFTKARPLEPHDL